MTPYTKQLYKNLIESNQPRPSYADNPYRWSLHTVEWWGKRTWWGQLHIKIPFAIIFSSIRFFRALGKYIKKVKIKASIIHNIQKVIHLHIYWDHYQIAATREGREVFFFFIFVTRRKACIIYNNTIILWKEKKSP